MVAFTVSMEPLEKLRGKAAADLLLRRAQGLMAMGPLLFVTVVEADQRPIADLASPGLEEESVLNAVPELLRAVSRTGIRQIERRDGVIYARSEEHTSELQSLMRISYAVFCLKKKKNN